MSRKHLIVLAALACSLLLSEAALAEGAWSSYLSYVLTGYESRTWTDYNVDAADTYVYFAGCRDGRTSSTNTAVALWQEISWWPNANLGRQTLYCYSSDWGSWGRVNAGDYYFVIDLINGSASGWRLDVDYVEVGY